MLKSFSLVRYGEQLWTRPRARQVRAELCRDLDNLRPGDGLVVDLKGVEAFDFSFANEFFGRTVMTLPQEYPGVFLIVEGLTDYTRENLQNAMESIGLMIMERSGKTIRLVGKVHPADEQTLAAILKAQGPITASALKDLLGIGLTAVNERLSKLSGLGLIRRERAASSAGREQYLYFPPT